MAAAERFTVQIQVLIIMVDTERPRYTVFTALGLVFWSVHSAYNVYNTIAIASKLAAAVAITSTVVAMQRNQFIQTLLYI